MLAGSNESESVLKRAGLITKTFKSAERRGSHTADSVNLRKIELGTCG